jgi:hypothetical protein
MGFHLYDIRFPLTLGLGIICLHPACSEKKLSSPWQTVSIEQPVEGKLIGMKSSKKKTALIWQTSEGKASVQELEWDAAELGLGEPIIKGPIHPWLSDDSSDWSILWWDTELRKSQGWILSSVFWPEPGEALEKHELGDFPPFGLAKARHGRNVAAVSGDRDTDRIVLRVSSDAGRNWSAPIALSDWRLAEESDYQVAISSERVAVLSISHTNGNSFRRLRLCQGVLGPEGVTMSVTDRSIGEWSIIGPPMACLRMNDRHTYVAIAEPQITVLQIESDSTLKQKTEIKDDCLPIQLEVVARDDGTLLVGWIDARHAGSLGMIGNWFIPKKDHRDIYAAVIEPGAPRASAYHLSQIGHKATELQLSSRESFFLASWTSVGLNKKGKIPETTELSPSWLHAARFWLAQ